MTWNPWKLRRMVREARGVENGLRTCISNLRGEINELTGEYLADSGRIAALTAEIARLKSPPRGDRGPRVGRGH